MEEFLLRENKSPEDVKAFHAKHWKNLPEELREYLQEKLFDENKNDEVQSGEHEEL